MSDVDKITAHYRSLPQTKTTNVGQQLTTNASIPTTEAGKRLLAAPSYHWQLCGVVIGDGPCGCDLPNAIAAIEAEAICGHEQKPGRWAFLDVETGEWIEVKPGVVWGAALETDHD